MKNLEVHPSVSVSRLVYGTLAVLVFLPGVAQAQLLGEVMTVAAISAELNPAVRLPSGSLRVVGTPPASLLAKVPDAASFSDWEAYTATGVAASLQPAHVHQITTSFAVAGYFLENTSERTLGNETHTRYLYSDATGDAALLYVIRTPEELWLIAHAQ